jgi:hypothetical protein
MQCGKFEDIYVLYMEHSPPDKLSVNVQRIIRRDFTEDQYGKVAGMLLEYGKESYEAWVERVRLGILKLANGDMARLANELEAAKRDPRDVLAYAEEDWEGLINWFSDDSVISVTLKSI